MRATCSSPTPMTAMRSARCCSTKCASSPPPARSSGPRRCGASSVSPAPARRSAPAPTTRSAPPWSGSTSSCLMLLLVDVQPYIATDYTLLAFIIVILGGLGSMPGALLGGLLVGVSEALSGFLIEPSFKSAFSFALLILVLLMRPQGLLGRA